MSDAPILPIPVIPAANEWLRVSLTNGKYCRIFVSGEMGRREIDALIKLLAIQRDVLDGDDKPSPQQD